MRPPHFHALYHDRRNPPTCRRGKQPKAGVTRWGALHGQGRLSCPGVQAEADTDSLVAKADSNLVCPACRVNVAERSDVREIGVGNRRVVQRDVDHEAEEIRAQPIQQPLGMRRSWKRCCQPQRVGPPSPVWRTAAAAPAHQCVGVDALRADCVMVGRRSRLGGPSRRRQAAVARQSMRSPGSPLDPPYSRRTVVRGGLEAGSRLAYRKETYPVSR
jgi:hypothetical protein